MQNDAQMPATKEDIAMLMREFARFYEKNDQLRDTLQDDNRQWQQEFRRKQEKREDQIQLEHEEWRDKFVQEQREWRAEINMKMAQWKEEIIHEFHILAEDIRHDALGANRDRLENHEDRIHCLEKHTKLVRA